MTFRERIVHLVESGFQIIYVTTAERSRCEEELKTVAMSLTMDIKFWDVISGFNGEYKDPLEALMAIDNGEILAGCHCITVMRNLQDYMSIEPVKQVIQNLYFSKKLSNDWKRPIIIIGGRLEIPPELAPCIAVVEFSLPDEKELDYLFTNICSNLIIDDTAGIVATYTEDTKQRIIQALKGLTNLEAENILCYSLRVNRGFGAGIVDTIEDQKALTLEKSEILSYIPKDKIQSIAHIGGYAALKQFIATRRLAYSPKARELGLDLPRGIVLMGCMGTGKSVVGKVIARELGLPLVIMNVSAIFGSLVGESERRIRTALNTIDALDGAVVLIDEAEKALGGASESVGDSGVSRRVFGVILTWLTEKTSRTFVVLTMNRVTGIPPEFLRRGRFDQIFYTDLPSPDERDEILKIHLAKRGVDPEQYPEANWKQLIEATHQYVGAELEQIVCDARFAGFADRQSVQPTVEELLLAAKQVIPIAQSESDNINLIRKMCEGRAVPVSYGQPTKKPDYRPRMTWLG